MWTYETAGQATDNGDMYETAGQATDNGDMYETAGQATDDNVVRRTRLVSFITKATNTHPEYVMPTAFPLQQWLRERASTLRSHVHYLFC
jgi:nicotinamidase-related amidase